MVQPAAFKPVISNWNWFFLQRDYEQEMQPLLMKRWLSRHVKVQCWRKAQMAAMSRKDGFPAKKISFQRTRHLWEFRGRFQIESIRIESMVLKRCLSGCKVRFSGRKATLQLKRYPTFSAYTLNLLEFRISGPGPGPEFSANFSSKFKNSTSVHWFKSQFLCSFTPYKKGYPFPVLRLSGWGHENR